ncbi:MAG: DUF839 domain-containing protein [Dehalococcoidia bacterium]|nr:DUF839 domain-containing protein [Dehalococcoidia bacterium]
MPERPTPKTGRPTSISSIPARSTWRSSLTTARVHGFPWSGVRTAPAGNGFNDQGEVCIKTRLAADLVGATKMERPEDIQTNPVNGKVYAATTNNPSAGTPGKAPVDAANPLVENRHGHIIELSPAYGGDHAHAVRVGPVPCFRRPRCRLGHLLRRIRPGPTQPDLSSPDVTSPSGRRQPLTSTDGQTTPHFQEKRRCLCRPGREPERGSVRQSFSGGARRRLAPTLSDTNDAIVCGASNIRPRVRPRTVPGHVAPDGKEPRPSVVSSS